MFSASFGCLNRKFRQKSWVPSEAPSRTPLLFLYQRWLATIADSIDELQIKPPVINRQDLASPFTQTNEITPVNRRQKPTPRSIVAVSLQKGDSEHDSNNSVHRRLPLRKDDVAEVIRRRLGRIRGNQLENVHDKDKRLARRKTSIRDHIEGGKNVAIAEQTDVDVQKAAKKKFYNPKSVDWLPIANMLAQILHNEDHSKGREITLSERLVYEYTGDVKPNMWIHKGASGCEVHVLPRDSSENSTRNVVLYGSPRAIDLTAAYFHHLEKMIQSPDRDEQEQKTESKLRLPAFTSLHTPTGLELPFVWSIRSFYRQVSRLVDRRVRRSIQKEVSTLSHNATIAAQLRLYFTDRLVSQHVSVLALNRALKFVCDHSELAATQEFLHTRARKLGIVLNVHSYGMLIAASLKANHVEKVKALLLEMRASRVPPNGLTWATVFAAISSADGRHSLLEQMKKADVVLDDAARSAMARVLIDDKFQSIQNSSSALLSVVEEMDKLFGHEWLDSVICNRMLHICSKREHWNLTAAVLQLRLDRKVKVDEKGIIYLASMSRRKGNAEGCISMLRTALSENHTKHNRFVIPQVFRSVWDRQCYNLCRVLWRYAATHGIITYEMQRLISTSLTKNTTKTESNTQQWKSRAGKVIVGMDLDTTHFNEHFPRLSRSSEQNPIFWLDQYTADDGLREEQRSLAYLLLHRDLTAWQRFAPISAIALDEMLVKALAMDGEWHKGKMKPLTSAAALHHEAIDVPLRRRTDERLLEPSNANDSIDSGNDSTQQEYSLMF